jgi:hypothetical protein
LIFRRATTKNRQQYEKKRKKANERLKARLYSKYEKKKKRAIKSAIILKR